MQVASQNAFLKYSVPTDHCIDASHRKHTTWLNRLAESLVASIPPSLPQICLRVKPRLNQLRNEILFKQNRNRCTIVVHFEDTQVVFKAFHLPKVDPTNVFKPRMGQIPEDTLTLPFNAAGVISEDSFTKAFDFCLKHLSAQTCYATGDYDRIKVTNSDTKISNDVFYAGKITKVMITPSGNWEIQMVNKGVYTTLKVDPENLAGPRPSVGMYLVYKNSTTTEVQTDSDFGRYYRFID